MDDRILLLEIAEAVATVTINRPDKRNALNPALLDDLEGCFRRLGGDPAVRAVIVTGAGEKAFVAGADINELTSLGPEAGRDWGRRGQQVFAQIERLEKPVIAALNGWALGGGLELAMACHLRVASETARLGQPEVKLGIVPGYGGTQRLARLIGKGRALEMLLTGDPISAAEAWRIGLVNRVVPAAELLPKCRELAATILKNGPVAAGLILQTVNRGLEMPLSEALEWEASQFGISCGTADMQEGIEAFLAKRPPDFPGR